MALEKQLITVEEFEAFIARPENADRRFELINGEIIEKMPTEEHGIIQLFIGTWINMYLFQNPIGRAGVEIWHRPVQDRTNDRMPDISVVLDKEKPVTRRGAALYIPDLAIEIKSPDDSNKAMREKAHFYLANGGQIVWLVFPDKKIIEVYTLDNELHYIEGDMLTGGDVLPGFELSVSAIFDSVK